jgi:folate-dependent phosphoribosylglycinamide formyltransferase PurN
LVVPAGDFQGARESGGGLGRPIRVVLFGGGPTLERGTAEFLCRLAAHPEIEFLGAFCQSRSQSIFGLVQDRWRRRRFLAAPLLLAEVAGLAGRYVTQPVAEVALRRRLARCANRIHYVPDVHAEGVLEQVRALQPDLGLAYGSPILEPKLFEIPRFGTLGIHHGQVPEYRGKKTMFWAMYKGEVTAGVTVQKINARLDRGDVVRLGQVPIGCRTPGAVWRELESLGLDLYLQAVLEVKEGTAHYRPQAAGSGRLYRDPTVRDILDFWVKLAWRCLGPGSGGT